MARKFDIKYLLWIFNILGSDTTQGLIQDFRVMNEKKEIQNELWTRKIRAW